MEICFQRATHPEEIAQCGICGKDFEPASVWVWVDVYCGAMVCETCLRWIGERAEAEPELEWPTFARYEELLRLYPEPMYGSPEQAEWGQEYEDAWQRSQIDG